MLVSRYRRPVLLFRNPIIPFLYPACARQNRRQIPSYGDLLWLWGGAAAVVTTVAGPLPTDWSGAPVFSSSADSLMRDVPNKPSREGVCTAKDMVKPNWKKVS